MADVTGISWMGAYLMREAIVSNHEPPDAIRRDHSPDARQSREGRAYWFRSMVIKGNQGNRAYWFRSIPSAEMTSGPSALYAIPRCHTPSDSSAWAHTRLSHLMLRTPT